jgi:Fe-S cluster assembly scaffold protein SufB
MREPQWARVYYGPIDYQDIYYYSAPKRKALASLDEVDPEILKTYDNTPVRAAVDKASEQQANNDQHRNRRVRQNVCW